MVDLPLDTREAAVNAITLPEVFHDFDTARRNLEDLNLEDQLSISQVHYLNIMFDERRTFCGGYCKKIILGHIGS
jgi:hypothetical protein